MLIAQKEYTQMKLPRRSFLKRAVWSTLSASLTITSLQSALAQKPARGRVSVINQPDMQVPAESLRDPILMFTRATFDPYVGGIFEAPNALGEMIELTLVSVKSFSTTQASKFKAESDSSDSFALTFSASAPLPEFTSIHNISHPALGKFNLFLTPRTGDEGQLLYEAVFNHAR
jgi:hypothetical protein